MFKSHSQLAWVDSKMNAHNFDTKVKGKNQAHPFQEQKVLTWFRKKGLQAGEFVRLSVTVNHATSKQGFISSTKVTRYMVKIE